MNYGKSTTITTEMSVFEGPISYPQTVRRREARFSESPKAELEVEEEMPTPKALQSPMPSSNTLRPLPVLIPQPAQPKTIWTALADKATELDHLVTLEGLVAGEDSKNLGITRLYDCIDKYTTGTHQGTASFADILLGTLPFQLNDEPAWIPDCQPVKMLRDEHPSSGYSSDCFEEDETSINARTHKLCFTEAQSLLIDCKVVDTYPNLDNPPSQINLVVMLLDISPEVDYFSLDSFISGLKPPLELVKVKFLFYAKRYSLVLQFKQMDIAKRFFQRCKEKSRNFEVFFGKFFQTSWAIIKSYNRESKMARHYDVQLPIKFFNDDFVGVVVRDLPEQTELREFESFLKKNGFDKGVEIQQILKFKHTTFCLVLLESVSRARKLCHWLNNYRLGKSKIKAHLHPETRRQSLMPIQDLILPTESEYGVLPKPETQNASPLFSSMHSDTAVFNAILAIEDVRVKDMVAKAKGWNLRMLSPMGNRSSVNLSSSPTDVMNSPFLEQVTPTKDKVVSGNTSLQKVTEGPIGVGKPIKASSSGKPASAKRESTRQSSRDHKSRDKRRRSYSSDSSCTVSEDSHEERKSKKNKDRGSRKSPKSYKRRSRSRTRSRSRGRDRDHPRKDRGQESKRDRDAWNPDDRSRKEVSNSARSIRRAEITVDNPSNSDRELAHSQKHVPSKNSDIILPSKQTSEVKEKPSSIVKEQPEVPEKPHSKCEEEKPAEHPHPQNSSPAWTNAICTPTAAPDYTPDKLQEPLQQQPVTPQPTQDEQPSKIDPEPAPAEAIQPETPSGIEPRPANPKHTSHPDAAVPGPAVEEAPTTSNPQQQQTAESENTGIPTYTAVKENSELEWYDRELLPGTEEPEIGLPSQHLETSVKEKAVDHTQDGQSSKTSKKSETKAAAVELDPKVDECVTWFDSHTNHVPKSTIPGSSALSSSSMPIARRSHSKDSKQTPTREFKEDRDKERERQREKDRERDRDRDRSNQGQYHRDNHSKGYYPPKHSKPYKHSWDQRRVDSDDRRYPGNSKPPHHKRF